MRRTDLGRCVGGVARWRMSLLYGTETARPRFGSDAPALARNLSSAAITRMTVCSVIGAEVGVAQERVECRVCLARERIGVVFGETPGNVKAA
jgi:hypothetical protein